MLLCVPPNMVKQATGAQPRSTAAESLESEGFAVWDGVSTMVRDSYPISVAQLRVVQYDSCRGLEGWVVIALGLDDLYLYKRESWQPPLAEPGSFTDDPEEAHRHASRWLMIPISRAVDTLVLHVQKHSSPVRDALSRAADGMRRFRGMAVSRGTIANNRREVPKWSPNTTPGIRRSSIWSQATCAWVADFLGHRQPGTARHVAAFPATAAM